MLKTKSSSSCQLLYAASESCADILYATNFFAPDPFLLLIHRGRKILVVGDLEIDRARRQASVDEVASLSSIEKALRGTKNKPPSQSQVIRFLLKERKINSAEIPFDFPAGLARELTRLGVHTRVKEPPFFEQREIKQPEEVRKVTFALRAAEKGMKRAEEMLRESVIGPKEILYWKEKRLTSELVKQAISMAALENGFTAAHTIVACGEQGCDPHEEGSGPLYAHQPIIIDIFPRSQATGYWGDITRTFVKGKASPALRDLYQAVQAAQKRAIRMVRPGVIGKEIHQAVYEEYSRRGFRSGLIEGRMQGYFHGTGHGVGLEIHELPRIGPKGVLPLRANQIVTMEPGLYYRGLGGVRLEDLLLITETGSRNLTRFPQFFEIS